MRPATRLLLGTLASLGVLLPLRAEARGAALASVRFIQGGLTVQPPSQPRAQGRVKESLFDAYFLQTLTGQKASIAFTDGTKLHMNQRTDAVLRSPTETVVRRGEVDELETAGAHHTITTATALAAALGTEFDVRITPPSPSPGYGAPGTRFPAGTTTVSVITGTVVVSNRFGSVTVRPNQWTHVPPGRAPTRPTTHNARADIAWTRGIPP